MTSKKEFEMDQNKLKPAYILSVLIAILATIVSVGGLLLDGLYRDNAFVKTTWLGNDSVTLFLATPILVAALVLSSRGSLKAQLVWMGMLDYMLYNYAFYLFGAAFNWFFLIYVALVGLSIFALIFGLANLDVGRIGQQFRERTPVKLIGGYFLFVAFGLCVVYFTQSILFITTGEVPAIVTRSGHITNVVFALDLTLLIPWFVLGAIWLMKRNPWGYVIAGIVNVKAPLYTFILFVNTMLVMKAGIDGGDELPLWITLTVLGLIACALLYGNMRTQER
jgi:hypothetical protein